MITFTVIATIVLIVLGVPPALLGFHAIRKAKEKKRLPAVRIPDQLSLASVLLPDPTSCPDRQSEPQPSASAHVTKAIKELITLLENKNSLGDSDVQHAIESCLRGREHLMKPLSAFLVTICLKAKKEPGASSRLAVIQAGHHFLHDIDRAHIVMMDLGCHVLQDPPKGLVDVIVLADFSLPVAKTLRELASRNPGKRRSTRVHLVLSDKHFISERDTSAWEKLFQEEDMNRFFEIENSISFAQVEATFATEKSKGSRVMFLSGAERVYDDGRILNWPGMGTIFEIAKMQGIEIMVTTECYKVQPRLKGEVSGYGTAADGKPIQLVPMPVAPGGALVTDHMVHDTSDSNSDRPIPLKCCHRHWLNQMEGKNLPLGVIFDLDGTLIDSEPLHEELYKEIANSQGYLLSDSEYNSKLKGMTDTQTIEAILRMAGKKGSEKKLAAEKQKKFLKHLAGGQIKAMPGAVTYVQALHEQGYSLALATSATREEANTALRILGLTDLFSTVQSAENTQNSKPAPDVYLNAAKALRLRPSECLVYEDSLSGIQAARSARIEVIAIGDDRNDKLRDSGACLVISDFRNHAVPEIGTDNSRGSKRS